MTSEIQIKMYMEEFKVDRITAMAGIEEFLDKFEEELRDTQQDLVNSTH